MKVLHIFTSIQLYTSSIYMLSRKEDLGFPYIFDIYKDTFTILGNHIPQIISQKQPTTPAFCIYFTL